MMLVGFPLALAMLAQAAGSAGPAQSPADEAPAAAPAKPPAAAPSQSAAACSPVPPGSTTIVICTQRPNGYRLNPDVMEARREMHSAGPPVRPGGGAPRPDCATVGPQPCLSAEINLLAAALTAAEMAKRLASGQEVGSMFLTDPQPDEYHRYLAAKARREAEEAQKAAAAKAKTATAPPPAAQTTGN
jgi:hypothetical protein